MRWIPNHNYTVFNQINAIYQNLLSVSNTQGGGVLPYMGYIGMCGPKGYGFSAVLVINWVSILAFCRYFGHK